MSLIREALSAFAAFKPTKNGGREALLEAMLSTLQYLGTRLR